ncbi:MAG: carboxymuconolactone decarboxylase family protein [Leadbetterella sp.]
MAYISIDNTLPGMRSLLAYRPAIAPSLTALMQILMRSDEGLCKGERELIAAYVSFLNGCMGCYDIHAKVSQCLLNTDEDYFENIKNDFRDALISDKLKALLSIAQSIQKGGKFVTTQQVETAKNQGASDLEIHDTVLISGLFCLFNKYIDGLKVITLDTPQSLRERAEMIAEMGYK